MRTSNFWLSLDMLIFVLNFRPKYYSKVLKISRFKFLKPINKDYLISCRLVSRKNFKVIIYKQCNIICIIFIYFLMFICDTTQRSFPMIKEEPAAPNLEVKGIQSRFSQRFSSFTCKV